MYHDFRTGDKVLCIQSFDFPWLTTEQQPQEKKVYTVRQPTDGCGCGYRILLNEFGTSHPHSHDHDAWFCASCFRLVPREVEAGWNHKRFIKVADSSFDLSQDEEIETKIPSPATV